MTTWKIDRIDCFPQYDGRSDVAHKAYWQCLDSRDGHTASAQGMCFLPPPSEAFIPYGELTESAVLGWVWESVSKADAESRVAADLERKINPPHITPALPWA